MLIIELEANPPRAMLSAHADIPRAPEPTARLCLILHCNIPRVSGAVRLVSQKGALFMKPMKLGAFGPSLDHNRRATFVCPQPLVYLARARDRGGFRLRCKAAGHSEPSPGEFSTAYSRSPTSPSMP